MARASGLGSNLGCFLDDEPLQLRQATEIDRPARVNPFKSVTIKERLQVIRTDPIDPRASEG